MVAAGVAAAVGLHRLKLPPAAESAEVTADT
jgi:hypothetical protein